MSQPFDQRFVEELVHATFMGRDDDVQPIPANVPPELRRVLGAMYKLATVKPANPHCRIPGCADEAIGSHTLHRSGPLRTLARDGRVTMFHAPFARGGSVELQARPKGVNEATVFRGLCSRHDAELFRAIDVETIGGTDHQLFLLSLRAALAYRWAQERHARAYRAIHEWVCACTGPTASPEAIEYARVMAESADIAVEIAERVVMSAYLSLLGDPKPLDSLHTIATRCARTRYATASLFFPRHSLGGTVLNDWPSQAPYRAPHWMTLCVIPDSRGSLIAISGPGGAGGRAAPLWLELDAALREGRLPDAVWELALREVSDVVFEPAAWDTLSDLHRKAILAFAFESRFARWRPWPGIHHP